MRNISNIIVFILVLLSSIHIVAQNPGDLYEDFGDDGIATYNYLGLDQYTMDMHILNSDKILLTGSSGSIEIVVKFNSNGTIDQSFGELGKVLINFGGPAVFESIVTDSDNNILIAGNSAYGIDLPDTAFIVKLNSEGGLVNDFGDEGVRFIEEDEYLSEIKITPDDKIVAIGWNEAEDNTPISCVIKLNGDGSWDNTFADNGMFVTDLSFVFFESVVLTEEQIYIAGTYNLDQISITKLTLEGNYKTSFRSDVWFLNDAYDQDYPTIKIDSEERLVVVASSPGGAAVVHRIFTDGSYDISFNGGYRIVTMGEAIKIYDMLIQEDDKIIIAGEYNDDDFLQIRLMENSSIDADFGLSGYCVTDINDNKDIAKSIGMQNDGNIVLGGSSQKDGSWNMALAKYYSGLYANIQDESIDEFDCTIHSNPIQDELVISIQNAYGQSCLIEIYGLDAKKYFSGNYKIENELLRINSLNLPAGMYILKIHANMHECIKKIIVE